MSVVFLDHYLEFVLQFGLHFIVLCTELSEFLTS